MTVENLALGARMKGLAAWIPLRFRRRLATAATRLTRWPPIGAVSMGDLGRSEPAGRGDRPARGTPIDWYYADRFLDSNAGAVRGRVLELGGAGRARRLGGRSVQRVDTPALGPDGGGEALASLPPAAYDCILAQHVVHKHFDVAAVVRALHRALAPGGILLATVPGIARHPVTETEPGVPYWSLTSLSARRVFADVFGAESARVETAGNVLAAAALLRGLAVEDLGEPRLAAKDPDFEVVVTIRAVRKGAVG